MKSILVVLALVTVLALVSVANAQDEPVLDFVLFGPIVAKEGPTPTPVRPPPTPSIPTPTPVEP